MKFWKLQEKEIIEGNLPKTRVARFGKGEAPVMEALSTTLVPDSCTELIRAWKICLRWAVVGVRRKTSSSSPVAPFPFFWDRSLSLLLTVAGPADAEPLEWLSFPLVASSPLDERSDSERRTATGRDGSLSGLLLLARGTGFGATFGRTKLNPPAGPPLSVDSVTDFRGLGVGTVFTARISSLRWLSGPRMTWNTSIWVILKYSTGKMNCTYMQRFALRFWRIEADLIDDAIGSGDPLTSVDGRIRSGRFWENVSVEFAVRLARNNVRNGHHCAGRQLKDAVHLAFHDAHCSFRHQTRSLALLSSVPVPELFKIISFEFKWVEMRIFKTNESIETQKCTLTSNSIYLKPSVRTGSRSLSS